MIKIPHAMLTFSAQGENWKIAAGVKYEVFHKSRPKPAFKYAMGHPIRMQEDANPTNTHHHQPLSLNPLWTEIY